MDTNITISICCITYNHEKYLRECLEGILIQKVNFEYEILIHDDASTDNTPSIINEYAKKFPNIIRPILQQENQYSKGISPLRQILFPIVKGKYIAICEGDDYWTDPLKLQKQVDFLENHQEYSLCCHMVTRINAVTGKMLDSQFIKNDMPLSNEDIIRAHGMLTPTLSMVFRSMLIKNMPSWLLKAPVGDISLTYHLMLHGKVFCFSSLMGVYRAFIPTSWTMSQTKQSVLKRLNSRLKYNAFILTFNDYTHGRYYDTLVSHNLFRKGLRGKVLLLLSNIYRKIR